MFEEPGKPGTTPAWGEHLKGSRKGGRDLKVNEGLVCFRHVRCIISFNPLVTLWGEEDCHSHTHTATEHRVVQELTHSQLAIKAVSFPQVMFSWPPMPAALWGLGWGEEGISQPPCFWSSTIYHSEFKAPCLETWAVQKNNQAKMRRWYSTWVSVSPAVFGWRPQGSRQHTGATLPRPWVGLWAYFKISFSAGHCLGHFTLKQMPHAGVL